MYIYSPFSTSYIGPQVASLWGVYAFKYCTHISMYVYMTLGFSNARTCEYICTHMYFMYVCMYMNTSALHARDWKTWSLIYEGIIVTMLETWIIKMGRFFFSQLFFIPFFFSTIFKNWEWAFLLFYYTQKAKGE